MLPIWGWRADRARGKFGLPSNWLTTDLQPEIDQILKGRKPSGIPFYQASKFELLLNLKVTKALGMTVPSSLLARANEVIEWPQATPAPPATLPLATCELHKLSSSNLHRRCTESANTSLRTRGVKTATW
jgi:ABC transporter substrate binding protein